MEQTVDFLIIGQGIAGTLLSYELIKKGKSVLVIDQPHAQTASRVAGAVISPLTGKDWKPTNPLWMTTALATYRSMAGLLKTTILQPGNLYLFPEGVENTPGFQALEDAPAAHIAACFQNTEGLKVVPGLWQVKAAELLDSWRLFLQEHRAIRATKFEPDLLNITANGLVYEDICAANIVFCEGAVSNARPWFPALPFTANRGDVLFIHVPGLAQDAVYQNRYRLIPRGNNLFWCGSNYRWKFSNLLPDEDWRAEVMSHLKQWLRLPFTLADHQVALRPTTAGQQPLLLCSAKNSGIFLFNGLGTKGFSAGPFLAQKMANLLLKDEKMKS